MPTVGHGTSMALSRLDAKRESGDISICYRVSMTMMGWTCFPCTHLRFRVLFRTYRISRCYLITRFMACEGTCCATSATPVVQAEDGKTTVRAPVDTTQENTATASQSTSCCVMPESKPTEDIGCCPHEKNEKKAVSVLSCPPEPAKDAQLTSKINCKEACAPSCCPTERSARSKDATSPMDIYQSPQNVLPLLPSGSSDCCTGGTSNQGSCVSRKTNIATIDAFEVKLDSNDSIGIDIEKSSVGREHVVLSVSGMTCTGCETKLQRTLATLPYIIKLRTSLILARAEFDIDLGAATADDVIKHLSRTTEFKCERVLNQGSTLDLICTGNPAELANGEWPTGVTGMRLLDKTTVRVDYDAEVVGARRLVERGWKSPMQLAALRPDPALDAGNRHVWHMGLMTLLSAVLTIPVLVMAWAPLPDHEVAYGSASLALATVVQLVIAGPFYPKAIKALVFSRVIEMDLLIVLSTTAAYVFSVVAFGFMIGGEPLSTGEFFETSTLLVTLIMVGRWIASLARHKVDQVTFILQIYSLTGAGC